MSFVYILIGTNHAVAESDDILGVFDTMGAAKITAYNLGYRGEWVKRDHFSEIVYPVRSTRKSESDYGLCIEPHEIQRAIESSPVATSNDAGRIRTMKRALQIIEGLASAMRDRASYDDRVLKEIIDWSIDAQKDHFVLSGDADEDEGGDGP